MPSKVLFVATVQSHIAQFHSGAIDLFKEKGYEVHVAARYNLDEKNGLSLQRVDRVFNIPFQRSPFSVKNLEAYNLLHNLVESGAYDVIHCNTPVGGMLGRLAARKTRKKGCHVIYTAHGFHFYKGAPIKNWLLYYPIEKKMARYTDTLVTINEEDYSLAKKKFPCSVVHIYGAGVKTKKYEAVEEKEWEKFRLNNGWKDDFLILCTGELNPNKNQSTVINAMKTVLEYIPNAKLLLAGNGPSEVSLRKLITNNHLEKSVILLGYRTDLEWFVHASDLVVSASLREGLGLNILEGMYCRKPVVASINRGHRELIENGVTGYLVPATNSNAFAERIIQLANDSKKRDLFGAKGYERSLKYTDQFVIKQLEKIYFD